MNSKRTVLVILISGILLVLILLFFTNKKATPVQPNLLSTHSAATSTPTPTPITDATASAISGSITSPSGTATPIPTPTPSPSPTPAAALTTYSNTKYNYSFRYPNTDTLSSGPAADTSVAINPTSDAINVTPSTSSQGPTEFYIGLSNKEFQESAILNDLNDANPTLDSTVVAGLPAFIVTEDGSSLTYYFIRDMNNNVFEIHVLNNNKEAADTLSSLSFK